MSPIQRVALQFRSAGRAPRSTTRSTEAEAADPFNPLSEGQGTSTTTTITATLSSGREPSTFPSSISSSAPASFSQPHHARRASTPSTTFSDPPLDIQLDITADGRAILSPKKGPAPPSSHESAKRSAASIWPLEATSESRGGARLMFEGVEVDASGSRKLCDEVADEWESDGVRRGDEKRVNEKRTVESPEVVRGTEVGPPLVVNTPKREPFGTPKRGGTKDDEGEEEDQEDRVAKHLLSMFTTASPSPVRKRTRRATTSMVPNHSVSFGLPEIDETQASTFDPTPIIISPIHRTPKIQPYKSSLFRNSMTPPGALSIAPVLLAPPLLEVEEEEYNRPTFAPISSATTCSTMILPIEEDEMDVVPQSSSSDHLPPPDPESPPASRHPHPLVNQLSYLLDHASSLPTEWISLVEEIIGEGVEVLSGERSVEDGETILAKLRRETIPNKGKEKEQVRGRERGREDDHKFSDKNLRWFVENGLGKATEVFYNASSCTQSLPVRVSTRVKHEEVEVEEEEEEMWDSDEDWDVWGDGKRRSGRLDPKKKVGGTAAGGGGGGGGSRKGGRTKKGKKRW